MTKEELVELVDRVYASWNQQIPQLQQKAVYDAWWRILKDLPAEDCHTALDQLIYHDSYMPRPGALYQQTIKNITDNHPPTPLEAWHQLRQLTEQTNNGTYQSANTHPLVLQTIQQLGGTQALNLHTNGDRDHFITTYNQTLNTHWQQQQKLHSPQ